jgi:hypothetical protein
LHYHINPRKQKALLKKSGGREPQRHKGDKGYKGFNSNRFLCALCVFVVLFPLAFLSKRIFAPDTNYDIVGDAFSDLIPIAAGPCA